MSTNSINKSNTSSQKSSNNEVNPWLIAGIAAGGIAIGTGVGIVGTRMYIKSQAKKRPDLVEGVKDQMAKKKA